jgi:ribosome-associated protein
LAADLLTAIEEKKGIDPKLLDLREVAGFTDLLILCSGTSTTHIQALARNIRQSGDDPPTYVNASPDDSWWVLDYVDVVVHVMRADLRAEYAMEVLWADAEVLDPEQVAGVRSAMIEEVG